MDITTRRTAAIRAGLSLALGFVLVAAAGCGGGGSALDGGPSVVTFPVPNAAGGPDPTPGTPPPPDDPTPPTDPSAPPADPTDDPTQDPDGGGDPLPEPDPIPLPPQPNPLEPFGDIHALVFQRSTLIGADVATSTLLEIDADLQHALLITDLAGLEIEALAYDPDAGITYAAEATTRTLIAIDPDLGMTLLGGAGALDRAGVRAMAFDSIEGILYAVDSDTDELLILDTELGTASVVAELSPDEADTIESMTYDPATASLVAVDRATQFLVDIDQATGLVRARGAIEFADIRGLALVPGTNTLYGIDTGLDVIVRIDRLTGETLGPAPHPGSRRDG